MDSECEIWVSLRTQITEFKIHARQCMHFEYLGNQVGVLITTTFPA